MFNVRSRLHGYGQLSDYHQQDRTMSDSRSSTIGGGEQLNVAERIKKKVVALNFFLSAKPSAVANCRADCMR